MVKKKVSLLRFAGKNEKNYLVRLERFICDAGFVDVTEVKRRIPIVTIYFIF